MKKSHTKKKTGPSAKKHSPGRNPRRNQGQSSNQGQGQNQNQGQGLDRRLNQSSDFGSKYSPGYSGSNPPPGHGLNPPPGRGLGRGLGSLIGAARPEAAKAGVLKLPIEQVQPDGHNPRKAFDDTGLDELADSIAQQGLLQPILVRREGAVYKLIAGERRWRAAQRAGLREIPALVREAGAEEVLEMALVENLQREDLSPLEEAAGYQRLLEERQWTQEQVAERVGKSRVAVTNALRLLQLPEEIKALLAEGRLEAGHARALLGIGAAVAMLALARKAAAQKWSVRQTEAQVRAHKRLLGQTPTRSGPLHSSAAKKLVEALQRKWGTRIRILEKTNGRGRLEIDYFSYEDLDRILARLMQ